ncbi:MAG: hypothetical protein BWZ09_02774 [Alphaproteobacteria bacterium ADurb.BinA305]|nr:MAG: hypothetical protein BWZ09_02774 [Alphaproteobacteria bacterium ADurb.BinA305]
MLLPRVLCQKPDWNAPYIMVISAEAPSTIAASTTCPLPEACASSIAHTTPKASSIPPPPKSPIRLSGTTGFWPFSPIACSAPVSAM